MVYWFLAPAVFSAVKIIVTAIAWLAGIIFVGGYARDIFSGESTPVEISEDETLVRILDDPTLTDEQKAAIIDDYLEKATEPDNRIMEIMLAVFVLILTYVILFMKK